MDAGCNYKLTIIKNLLTWSGDLSNRLLTYLPLFPRTQKKAATEKTSMQMFMFYIVPEGWDIKRVFNYKKRANPFYFKPPSQKQKSSIMQEIFVLSMDHDMLARELDKTIICQIRNDLIEVVYEQRFQFPVRDVAS